MLNGASGEQADGLGVSPDARPSESDACTVAAVRAGDLGAGRAPGTRRRRIPAVDRPPLEVADADAGAVLPAGAAQRIADHRPVAARSRSRRRTSGSPSPGRPTRSPASSRRREHSARPCCAPVPSQQRYRRRRRLRVAGRARSASGWTRSASSTRSAVVRRPADRLVRRRQLRSTATRLGGRPGQRATTAAEHRPEPRVPVAAACPATPYSRGGGSGGERVRSGASAPRDRRRPRGSTRGVYPDPALSAPIRRRRPRAAVVRRPPDAQPACNSVFVPSGRVLEHPIQMTRTRSYKRRAAGGANAHS